jgi:hypothetical protein
MTDKLTRLADWIEAEMKESEYLSHKENWTPRLTRVAREFLVVGWSLGGLLGLYIGGMAWGG